MGYGLTEREALEAIKGLIPYMNYYEEQALEKIEKALDELERLRNNERILMLYVKEGSLKEVHEAMEKYRGSSEQNE